MENITSSKLFRTRQGTLMLGVVAAVLAAIALLVYLRHYRDSVNKTAATLSVLEAKRTIPKNTPGSIVASTALYKLVTIPKSDVRSGALTDPTSLSGTVALQVIYPGAQLTTAEFGVATNPVAAQLPKGQRAVVIPLDSPSEVGGQVTPGDHVDVWVLANKGATPVAHEMLQNMYVINAGANGGNVTLQATPQQSGELIYASNNEKIWLVLRPTVGSITKPPTVNLNNLLGG